VLTWGLERVRFGRAPMFKTSRRDRSDQRSPLLVASPDLRHASGEQNEHARTDAMKERPRPFHGCLPRLRARPPVARLWVNVAKRQAHRKG